MTRLLEGRTALVTGGSQGIGLGCARRLLEHGARVTIVARTIAKLEEAAQQLRAEIPGARIDFKACDVMVEADVAAAVAAAAGETGHLDVAVSNVGSASPGPLLRMTADDWDYACRINIMANAFVIKRAALAMRERGGSIVTISSVAGSMVEKWLATYSTTKAAVEMLTQCAALELAPFQIRVNCIRPGYVPTPGTELGYSEALKQRCIVDTPLGRPGRPEDIGDAVVFLASDLSRWLTGQVFGVDGGMGVKLNEDFEDLARLIYSNEVMDDCLGLKRK
jgi:NAD(P)-dependent dehydrogenase (short-subunit alcohol dehydrogenase family)